MDTEERESFRKAAFESLGPNNFNRLIISVSATKQLGRLRYWQEQLLARIPAVGVGFEEFISAFDGSPRALRMRHMTNDPFFAALAANPTDRTARLVYADWLEERDDQRHHLVRLCERMRQVPVFSDEYWQLKATRNERRRGCDAEWLAATGYDGSAYDPIFRNGIPHDWKGRWRVVREFTERWHDLPMPDVGSRTETIRAAEERLGLTLPPSVREYIAFAHDVFPDADSRQVIRDWYTMERLPDQPAISLLIQGEGDVHWSVQLADLSEADPMVHTYVWDREYEGPDETRPFVPYPNEKPRPLSEWILGYVEGYNGAHNHFMTTVRDVDRVRGLLEAEFSVLRPPQGVGQDRYEHTAGILAWFYPDTGAGSRSGQHQLWVGVRKGVPWQAIPEFLWEFARQAHGRGGVGMFFTQEDVEVGLSHWGTNPVPPEIPREAVPPMRSPPMWTSTGSPPPPPSIAEDDIPF